MRGHFFPKNICLTVSASAGTSTVHALNLDRFQPIISAHSQAEGHSLQKHSWFQFMITSNPAVFTNEINSADKKLSLSAACFFF